MKDVTPKRLGRPSRFNEMVKQKIVELAGKGLTDKEVASIIGVSTETLRVWKRDDIELAVSTKEAKFFADRLVEEALFHRATGYSHPEQKVVFDKNTGEHEIIEVIKYVPPDTVAAAFWLKNRQPDKWREKTEVRHEGLSAPTVNITLPSNGREVIDITKQIPGVVEADAQEDAVLPDLITLPKGDED